MDKNTMPKMLRDSQERGKRLMLGMLTVIVGLVIALLGAASLVREVCQ